MALVDVHIPAVRVSLSRNVCFPGMSMSNKWTCHDMAFEVSICQYVDCESLANGLMVMVAYLVKVRIVFTVIILEHHT